MLPSSRRPKEVEEERAELLAELAKEKAVRNKLVLKTSKVDIFRKTMADWYTDLSEKQKRRLSPIELKRKAVQVCFSNGIVYDRLPEDWVTELKDKYGMKLFIRKRDMEGEDTFNEKVDVKKTPGESSRSTRRTSTERAGSRRQSSSSFSPKPGTSSSAVNESTSDSKPPPPSLKESTKRFLDHSNMPPPPFWLQKYAEGIVLPRILTVYSTEDTNILHYDYNPKLKDQFGRPMSLAPQPRSNINMIENFLIETQDIVDEKRRRKRIEKEKQGLQKNN